MRKDPRLLILSRVKQNKIAERLIEEKAFRAFSFHLAGLIANLIFCCYHGILGILNDSLLLGTFALYHFLLGTMKSLCVWQKKPQCKSKEETLSACIGVLLILLGTVFSSVVFFSLRDQSMKRYGEIPMITLALYTFIHITLAILSAIRNRRLSSPLLQAINFIRYAQVAVSLLTLQQSMLVSFGEMNSQRALLLNACTGLGVYTLIVLLGILCIKRKTQRKQ